MGLGFEVHWLDCASVAFILLCWLFGAKKKNKKKKQKQKTKEKKKEKRKEKSYAHTVFTSFVYGISMVFRRYYGLIIRGHFLLKDLFFF